MNVRQNEGYVITDSFHIGSEEFVLGISITAPNKFVTWRCRHQTDYYWGHYFSDLFAAQKDFAARIQKEIAHLEEEKNMSSETFSQPSASPWGEIQTCETLFPGVYSVTTASHGGIMALRDKGYQIFSKEALDVGFMEGMYICFEEDCDAPVAFRELMDRGLYRAPVNASFSPGEFEQVINRSLQTYHPEYWKARENSLAEQKERQNPQIKKKMKEHER